ncbi:MAG: toxin-antitoxin system YwqK family antitoxin [Bacteroidia bacterium]
MKNIIIFVSVIFTVVTTFSKRVYSQADTTKIPDLVHKDMVYCEIKNAQGNVHEAGNLLKGKKEGVWRTYNDHDGLSTLEEFKDNVLNGIKVQFDESGYISVEASFRNGKLNGKRTEFRYGTVKKFFESYADGVLDGNKKTFYESGTLQEDGNYKKGKRDGLVKWFNQEEKPTIEYMYKMGVIEGSAKTFFASGKIQSEGNYKNDNETGEWKEYDEDGNLLKTTIYDNGKVIKETEVKKK